MRLFANLLLTASLIAGLFGAVTAYLPSLDLPDDRLVGLTLNAPAGIAHDAEGTPGAVAAKDARLTTELIASLRAAGVRRVRVKEFAFARWSGAWLFLAGCAGLATGALWGRKNAKRTLAVSQARSVTSGEGPESILAAIRRAIDDLRVELPGLRDPAARCHRALDVLGAVQDNLVPDFVAFRPVLIARFGLAGYARLMDRFAAGERQVNRAWSAAADGVESETTACLEEAARLLTEAAERLPASGAGGAQAGPQR